LPPNNILYSNNYKDHKVLDANGLPIAGKNQKV
jgi:hypothetical protein